MDPTAVRELIALESGQFDASFEYWLAASFAVVLAAHAARDSMVKVHRFTLSGVYVLFCLATAAKAWSDLNEIGQLNDLLVDTALNVNNLPNRVAVFARTAIYVVFSVVVTAFVLLSGSWATGENDA